MDDMILLHIYFDQLSVEYHTLLVITFAISCYCYFATFSVFVGNQQDNIAK